MSKPQTEVQVTYIPICDICIVSGKPEDAAYDGRTKDGPWANMCEDCFKVHGVGLGLGKGQKLILIKGA